MTSSTASKSTATGSAALCIGALGIVFGDIGTSPLYTMKECMAHLSSPAERIVGVIGVLSLMLWTLVIVVCVKYLGFIMRADNRGEGGIFALLALCNPKQAVRKKSGLGFSIVIILLGAALLYGDSVITPAISVLSAAEGFTSINPGFAKFVVPVACIILALLFWVQRKGTKTISVLFGPIMLIWFIVLGGLGLWHVFEAPQVFTAINPWYGLRFLFTHPAGAFIILGSVVLTVTGAEALYADMGHFGRRAITQAWYFFAFPGLMLNYFGQGAHVLAEQSRPNADITVMSNPFFALAPEGWPRVALTLLSIVAAIIASQAVISGAFSLARSAIQLGYFPRLTIKHTNAEQAGQIYVPLVNISLAILSIVVVATFGSSDRLAAAYGIAVTGTMAVTTYAFYLVTRMRWNWPRWQSLLLCGFFLIFDLLFFVATAHKFMDGGWLPVGIALAVLAIMHTWKSGKNEIQEKVYSRALADLELGQIAQSKSIVRVPGSAIFMAGSAQGVPLALLHHLKANKVLQQTTVLMTMVHEDDPHIVNEERLQVLDQGNGVWRAIAHYGYMETPDLGDIMQRVKDSGVPLVLHATTFYFNREMIITGGTAKMWKWQKGFYGFLSRNARPVKDYYQIMPTQIIEIGLPIQL